MDRDCNSCIHHTEKGCRKWDCEYEKRMSVEEALCYLYDIKTDVFYQITTNERRSINLAMEAIEKLQEIKKALGEVNKALGEVGEKE